MADTNWLVAMFFVLDGDLKIRNQIVGQFLRKHGEQMLVPAVARLEVENVFRQEAEDSDPQELVEFNSDKRFYREPMNWNYLMRDATILFRRYASKAKLGTFDVTLLAAAKLDGATTILSFDERFKALAAAEGLNVYPPLNTIGKAELQALRS